MYLIRCDHSCFDSFIWVYAKPSRIKTYLHKNAELDANGQDGSDGGEQSGDRQHAVAQAGVQEVAVASEDLVDIVHLKSNDKERMVTVLYGQK